MASGLRKGLTSYGDQGFSLFFRTAFIKAMGFSDDALDRPIVGITNTFSDFNPCHGNVPDLIVAIKRGVMLAGGLPMEFPTISIHEAFAHPTSMFLRNLMALDTEEMIRAQPMDAVVLVGGCDKTLPAQLMAAASADIPAIVVPTGSMLVGHHRGEVLGACTDCRRLWAQYRAGKIDAAEIAEISGRLAPTKGTCMVMGTASTVSSMVEALGMCLPGGGTCPAVYSERIRIAEASGAAAVRLAAETVRPRDILTPAAFRNAFTVLQAIGGSTNAIVHFTAVAGRLRELAPLLDTSCRTVGGVTIADVIAAAEEVPGQDVIRPRERPIMTGGGLAVLHGNLAPGSALIKRSAASPELLRHEGRAVVFESVGDMVERIDDESVGITPDDVIVMRNAGPKGAPGMPEAGYIPIPRYLARAGVKDMVRISDARMSGTAFGTIVLHITPESAVGGPLGLVRDGDMIRLDVAARRIDLLVDDAELAARRAAWVPPAPPPGAERGYLKLYLDEVLQADQGCDFRFCLPAPAGR